MLKRSALLRAASAIANAAPQGTSSGLAMCFTATQAPAALLAGQDLGRQQKPSFATVLGKASLHTTRPVLSDFSDEGDDYATLMVPLYPPPSAVVGNKAPHFETNAVVNNEFKAVSLDQFKGQYVVLFFYPKDFTYVCPTEIIAFSDRAKEFAALNTQLIACSTDTEESHMAWIRTPRSKGGLGYMQIPILADTTKVISARYGVLKPEAGVALRGLFIINPEGVLEQITINNMPIGRSVDETLRLLQAIQYVKEHGEVCPANWKPGEPSMVPDSEKALEYFANTKDTDSEAIATKLQPLTSRKDFDAAVKSGGPVVVDFYAPWCGKCRQLGPFLDELVDKHPNVKFFKLDTTHEPLEPLCAELGVKTLPAFKFYKGGKEVHQPVTGYKKQQIAEAVGKM